MSLSWAFRGQILHVARTAGLSRPKTSATFGFTYLWASRCRNCGTSDVQSGRLCDLTITRLHDCPGGLLGVFDVVCGMEPTDQEWSYIETGER